MLGIWANVNWQILHGIDIVFNSDSKKLAEIANKIFDLEHDVGDGSQLDCAWKKLNFILDKLPYLAILLRCVV